jgi:hypothetical protein
MHSSWCSNFLSDPPPANRWIRYSRSFAAIGGKHILAADTSCSRAPNATAQCAFCMRGTHTTASSFSVVANALASPISPQWATGGTARRVASRSCALGSNGESSGTVPIKPRGMHEKTYQLILGMLAYHEVVRRQGVSYVRKYRPEQHRALLWRQCRNRFAVLGGWPVR